jgi:competence protein ComEA
MSELLRPDPPRSWSDRVRELLDRVRDRPVAAAVAAVALGLVVVAAAVVFFTAGRRSPPAVDVELPFASGATASAPSTTLVVAQVVVHVAGAVLRPGLYRLRTGARVADALEAAGGLTPEADVDRLNLAAPVADGTRVYVVRRGEREPPPVGTGAPGDTGADAVPLDLNAATLEQLDALPGIGPSTAQAILEHRTRIGRFRSVDELLDVRGIGPAKLEQIRSLVVV